MQDGGPVELNEVLWAELSLLKHADGSRPAPALTEIYRRLGDSQRAPTTALCFSGGGIRSASFNLGILQALTRRGLLGTFDYVSSVSGGGYIAGWLRAWCHHSRNLKEVEAAIATPAAAAG